MDSDVPTPAPRSGAVAPAKAQGDLRPRPTADGSPSLWSETFAEGFHSGEGALSEALSKFVAPAQLERFAPGHLLQVVDVGVGLGYNSAALLEAARARGLRLRWWGLELDPRPLGLALADSRYRGLWQADTLALLEQLHQRDHWRSEEAGEGRWLRGDARQTLPRLLATAAGSCDLVLHDAFSPGRCPQLWSLEFLGGLARLLRPDGRLLTYCSAAAVRQALLRSGLELASLGPDAGSPAGPDPADGSPTAPRHRAPWSLGTAASPAPLPEGGPLRRLSPMELDHLSTRAAEPYRDPSGQAEANTILTTRRAAQAAGSGSSTSAWRRRWGLEPGLSPARSAGGTASTPPPAPAAPPGGG